MVNSYHDHRDCNHKYTKKHRRFILFGNVFGYLSLEQGKAIGMRHDADLRASGSGLDLASVTKSINPLLF